MGEEAILNPELFVPELEELNLDSLGLAVRVEGVDWGEASITPQMVKQLEGELSSSGHRQGVAIKVPIRVKEESGVPLATAANKLESTIAGWQDHGGYIERRFDSAAGFSGSVAYRIIRHTASLSGLQGWLFAHRREAPDVVLTAVRWPVGLSTKESETKKVTVSKGRHAIVDLEDLGGTVGGLIDWEIENENEKKDFRAVVFSAEHHSHPQDETADTTAALHYGAADLTPEGGSEAETISGIEFVQCPELTPGWLTVLSSQIDGVGHMTHVDPRWILIRQEATLGTEWKLEYRTLGGAAWITTVEGSMPKIAKSPLSGWQLLDLGVARPERAVIGKPRWEFRIQARMPEGSSVPRIADVYVLSAEQRIRLADSSTTEGAVGTPTMEPGELAQGEAETGKTVEWEIDEGEGTATATLPAEKTTRRLLATDFGFELPSNARLLSVDVNILPTTAFLGVRLMVQLLDSEGEPLGEAEAASGLSFFRANSWDLLDLAAMGVDHDMVNTEGFGVAVYVENTSDQEREVGIDRISLKPEYDNGGDLTRTCFAGRKLQIGSLGCYRQHADDTDSWARLIEEGSPPVAPPGRLENRKGRAIIIPSQGDLATRGDQSDNSFSVQAKWHRGYLFAPEAAS